MSKADAAPALPIAAREEGTRYQSQGYFQSAWRRLRRNTLAMICLVALGLICLSAIFAPWINANIVGYDPNRGRLTERFQPPSAEHWLGTDEFGRDILARLIVAGRVSLSIGFMVAAISLTLGISLGLIAAYYGRWADDGINALIQIWTNIPTLFVLIMLSVLFRPGIFGLAFIFGILGWEGIARQVRGRVLSERRRDYVDAAQLLGAGNLRIMYRHILPNISSIVLVITGFNVASAILLESGVSALGFGVRIPTASWGNMLAKSLEFFDKAWWMVVAPGVLISITVFCFLYLADALRDALDPRLKESSRGSSS
jgi:peptide/nickel transport system permease protein